MADKQYRYNVARLAEAPVVDAKWDKDQWKTVPPLTLSNHMGRRPEHFPGVEAKLGYHGHDIAVIFRVEDRYVRAVETKNRGRIWEDSCVEFFVVPSADTADGYFNIEMNCCGRFLCDHQISRGVEVNPLADADMMRFKVAGTVREPVMKETADMLTWVVEYSFPADILAGFSRAVMPAPGVVWRANFYKCADLCSHPHWLTWAHVDSLKPDFHLPQFFGEIVFN